MKTKKQAISLLGVLFSLPIIFTSCGSDDSSPNPPTPDGITPPTAQQFKALKDKAIENRTQSFDFFVNENTGNGNTTITTPNQTTVSVSVPFGSNGFTQNGNQVFGDFKVDFTELYTKADLLLTGFGTVGKHDNGDLEMLVTGGAFRAILTKNEEPVQGNLLLNLEVPTSLTGGVDNDMSIWDGNFNEQGNLVWEEVSLEGNNGSGGVQITQNYYYVFGEGLTHINIDRFWDDTNPKTNVSVSVPQGYDSSNSGVFVSFDNILGILWSGYDSDQTKFNTGSIPIGITCNVVFVTESNGKWVYAIKPYTIAQNGTIEILSSDLNIANSETEMVNLINALP